MPTSVGSSPDPFAVPASSSPDLFGSQSLASSPDPFAVPARVDSPDPFAGERVSHAASRSISGSGSLYPFGSPEVPRSVSSLSPDDFGMIEATCQILSCYLEAGDYGQAFEHVKASAKRDGGVVAVVNLAHCYLHGLGVAQNIDLALDLYTQMAGRAEGFGHFGVWECRHARGDCSEALESLRLAVREGVEPAIRALERCRDGCTCKYIVID